MAYNIESFCPELWSQLEIDFSGDFKLCCLANLSDDFGMARDDNDRVMNILTDSIEEAINSKTHKEHRLWLKDNIKPTRCRNCYDSEESTRRGGWPGISKRQRVLTQTSPTISEYVTIQNVNEHTNDDGSVNSKVVNLDIRFSNLCNQKCIMCGPRDSSLWYEDYIKISKIGHKIQKGKYKIYPFEKDNHGKLHMQGFDEWWNNPIWWEKFDKISSDLRYIYFTGGEPLLVPAMQECLDRLITKGYAKNIQLRYDTNLSVLNNKIIDKWKNFKKVILCISLDDTNERFNLIRFPGNYNKFIDNLDLLVKNKIPIAYLSGCIGVASPYSVQRVIEIAAQYDIEAYLRFLEIPTHFDIRHFPKNAKLEIIENLEKFDYDYRYKKWVSSEINILKKYLDVENQKEIQEFVRVMDILDVSRGTNWRDTLSDVTDLIKRHCKDVNL